MLNKVMKNKTETKQKKITKKFFNEVAKEWFERTYDPSGNYLKFPVNRLRKDVALVEINNLKIKKGKKTLDIGCGTGQLVIDLLKKGMDAYGIDVASKMIDEANKNLFNVKLSNKKVFRVADLSCLSDSEPYDAVTSLGLLEYLDTDEELFSVLPRVVRKGGYVLVECRNSLFSLFTGNKYTLSIFERGGMEKMVQAFFEAVKFSPVPVGGISKIQKEVFKNIHNFLNINHSKKEWNMDNIPLYSSYPKKMVRRQHTPQDLDLVAKKYGFTLDYVVYYHLHPYPPYYEKFFPQIYNKISDIMTPIGRTYLGAALGSAFVGILRKK